LNTFKQYIIFSLILLAAFGPAAAVGWALQPGEILVIANGNADKSVDLAKHYVQKRSIPADNLLVLRLTEDEQCSRDEYDKKVAGRVRMYLREKDPDHKIRCLLTMYGMPLKVAQPQMSPAEETQVKALEMQKEKLSRDLKLAGDQDNDQTRTLRKDLQVLKKSIAKIAKSDARASLDSELALVREENYSLGNMGTVMHIHI
jgi:uncharacterized protein (TIGR03790 family)